MSDSTSLLLIDSAEGDLRNKGCTEAIRTKKLKAVYALLGSGSCGAPDPVQALSEEKIGRSLFCRIRFFADAEHVPCLLAPLLVRSLWRGSEVRDVIVGYPGVPLERLLAGADLLSAGCEAVLLRGENCAPLVVALSRSARNERLIEHWAGCVEQFSLEPGQQCHVDSGFGASVVEYLCDRIGSVRDIEREQPAIEAVDSMRGTMPPAVREAVRALLPESQLLVEDPQENAIYALNSPSTRVKQEPGNLVTSLMFAIWSSRPDLQAAYPISETGGRHGLADWFLGRASIELGVGEQFLAPIRAARKNGRNNAAKPDQQQTVNRGLDFAAERKAGVNLVGYSRADMGMGELLRQSASALSTTKVRICTVDFNHGITASQKNTSCESLSSTTNPYVVNLFHINADQMGLAREKLGPEFFRNRYNIGYWAWELSNFPNQWQSSIDLLDEIWAPSRFIRDAICAQTSKPVIWMPPAVEFPRPSAREVESVREKLQLPRNKFLFLFAFDFSSFGSRKNFDGCIRAFREAFPDQRTDAALVLKTIRHGHQNREYWKLLRTVGDDSRIVLVDQVLPQAEMRSLIAACDSFVSLHRSEGFGFSIAEAMLLGKPVIVTNYSGNVDFTNRQNSCLVDYELVPVKPNQYVVSDGARWAEPNLHQAAEYMRRLAGNPAYAAGLGRSASVFISEHHSCKFVGERQAARLDQVARARDQLTSFTVEQHSEPPVLQRTGGGWHWAVKNLLSHRAAD